MKESEKRAREKLKKYDVHVTRKGGQSAEEAQTTKSTSLRNLRDAVSTFRKGK